MLIDTNVLIASAVESHPDHQYSRALLETSLAASVSAHSLSEFVSIITRLSRYGWSGRLANRQLEKFEQRLTIEMLTAEQWVSAVREFTIADRRGPLVYDWLIGRVAVERGLGTIVTWNIKDMTILFPTLRVVTPEQLLQES